MLLIKKRNSESPLLPILGAEGCIALKYADFFDNEKPRNFPLDKKIPKSS